MRTVALEPPNRWVLALFGVGVVLRLVTMIVEPVTLTFYGGDSTRYLRLPFTGFHGLFSDPGMPAGYPAFLHAARWISREIAFTIGLQHLFGVLTAALLWLTLRSIGCPRWAAAIPAAVALLSGDLIFLEASLLTETLWILLLAAALWALLTATGARNSSARLICAGVLFALAAIVRNLALPLAVLGAAWVVWDYRGPIVVRLRAGGLVLIPAVLVVVAYLGVASAEHGYASFSNAAGFNLYGRVGAFADCRDFAPPRGTAQLCESSPPDARNVGPIYYEFSPASPLNRVGFGANPRYDSRLTDFALTAIVHQPLDYLRAVGKDLLRIVAPTALTNPVGGGATPAGMSFANSVPQSQAQSPELLASQYSQDYSGVEKTLPGLTAREALGSYGEVFRLNGTLIVALLVVAVLGVFAARGRLRRCGVLLVLLAAYLYVMPVALDTYDIRYATPAGLFLSAAGGVGAWAIVQARSRPSSHTAE